MSASAVTVIADCFDFFDAVLAFNATVELSRSPEALEDVFVVFVGMSCERDDSVALSFSFAALGGCVELCASAETLTAFLLCVSFEPDNVEFVYLLVVTLDKVLE